MVRNRIQMRTEIEPTKELNIDQNIPNIPELETKVEVLDIKNTQADSLLKLSTIPIKRGPGRPKLNGEPSQTKPALGRTIIGPTPGVSAAPMQSPADHKFTISKIFTVSEKVLQRRFQELPESSKFITPEKEIESLSKDVNTGFAVIFPNSLGASKIIAAVGILISISVYLADKYLLFKELQAKLNAKLSKSTNTPDSK